MNSSKEIIIKFSKSKLVFIFLGSLFFVLFGLNILYNHKEYDYFLILVGFISVVFFGFSLVFSLDRIFTKVPGLIINEKGIVDNSSGVKAGFIPWQDIIKIDITTVGNNSFVNLIVRDPKKYINKNKNFLKKFFVTINYKTFKTAIGIPATALDCDFEYLFNIINDEFQKHKSNSKI